MPVKKLKGVVLGEGYFDAMGMIPHKVLNGYVGVHLHRFPSGGIDGEVVLLRFDPRKISGKHGRLVFIPTKPSRR